MKLLACPFCGVIPELENVNALTEVRCENESCTVKPISTGMNDYEGVIDAWNTRPKPVAEIPADTFTRYYYLATYIMTVSPRHAITTSDIFTKEVPVDTLVTTIDQFNAMENAIARELLGKPGLGSASVKLINLDFLGEEERG